MSTLGKKKKEKKCLIFRVTFFSLSLVLHSPSFKTDHLGILIFFFLLLFSLFVSLTFTSTGQTNSRTFLSTSIQWFGHSPLPKHMGISRRLPMKAGQAFYLSFSNFYFCGHHAEEKRAVHPFFHLTFELSRDLARICLISMPGFATQKHSETMANESH